MGLPEGDYQVLYESPGYNPPAQEEETPSPDSAPRGDENRRSVGDVCMCVGEGAVAE